MFSLFYRHALASFNSEKTAGKLRELKSRLALNSCCSPKQRQVNTEAVKLKAKYRSRLLELKPVCHQTAAILCFALKQLTKL